MRALTLCAAGKVRSAAMAWALKDCGIEAVPAGLLSESRDFILGIGNLVDKVILMDNDLLPKLPSELTPKLTIVDLGPDVWMNPLHRDLIRRVRSVVKLWGSEGRFSNVTVRPPSSSA